MGRRLESPTDTVTTTIRRTGSVPLSPGSRRLGDGAAGIPGATTPPGGVSGAKTGRRAVKEGSICAVVADFVCFMQHPSA